MTRQNAGLPMAASSWPEPGPFVRRGIILLACAITAFFPCAAQDCVDYRDFPNFVGYYYTRYDRAVYDVDVSGPFAYTIINRWGVRVLDISDPANPVVRGTCQTAYQGTRISVWNSYVVVNSAPGLQLVDTTNPDSLRIVGSLDLDYYVWDFAIAESLAYVAADDGLKVVDLANPEAPELVASLDCFGQTRGVAVDGGYAYVTADSSLRVVDIADPLNPHVVGRLAVGPEAGPISAAGGLACMITQPGFFPDPDPTVHIIDVSNPQEPHWSASIAPSGGAGHIELAGGFAYVTGWGLQIIDISNPNAPRVVGGADPDGESGCGEGLTVKGGYIYVAISGDVEPPDWDGLQIFVANDSRCPEPVGELGESFEVIRVSGSTAYAAVDWHLTTFNIADPQHPEILDTIMLPGYAEDVVIHETRAYIATSWYDSGFHIVDISDPRDLRMVGTLDLPGHARGVDVSGTYAFVADWDVGLQVIDIADPQHPTAVGGPGILCSAARVSGGYLYLQSDTLRIMDIEDPLHPQEAATIDVSTFDIVFEDHYAYATTSDGLQIIDVEDPLDPRVLGGVDIPGVGRLSVLWPFAYIGTGHIGLQVVDISDPEFPLHVGGATDFCAWSTAVSETHVLSADRILPLQCDSTDAPDTDSSPNLIVRSYPNPGCRGAMLRLELPAPGRVRAAVHDLTGRQIRLLFDRVWPVGGHDFAWDGRDQEGNPVTSGLYLIRINTQNGDVATARALIIR